MRINKLELVLGTGMIAGMLMGLAMHFVKDKEYRENIGKVALATIATCTMATPVGRYMKGDKWYYG